MSLQSAIRGFPTCYPFGKSEMVSTYYATCSQAQGRARHTPHSESLVKNCSEYLTVILSLFYHTNTIWLVSQLQGSHTYRQFPSHGHPPRRAFFLLPELFLTALNFSDNTGSRDNARQAH